jgi:hypothetical protein
MEWNPVIENVDTASSLYTTVVLVSFRGDVLTRDRCVSVSSFLNPNASPGIQAQSKHRGALSCAPYF